MSNNKDTKLTGFKALRHLPPPSPEVVAQIAADFPNRLKRYEKEFEASAQLEDVSDKWMDRSYNC